MTQEHPSKTSTVQTSIQNTSLNPTGRTSMMLRPNSQINTEGSFKSVSPTTIRFNYVDPHNPHSFARDSSKQRERKLAPAFREKEIIKAGYNRENEIKKFGIQEKEKTKRKITNKVYTEEDLNIEIEPLKIE